mgnify:CR=1 FL=1|tara:strand:+ start:267 stop:686 length:420 start_codon:yes stop_codon:yes gene_type:complete
MSIGFDEFLNRLSDMEGRLTTNIRNALLKNALRMESHAKRNATSFPKVVTGRLRNSIIGTVKRFQEDEYLILRAGGLTVPTRPFSESADVVYAAIQEFGGGQQNIKPKFYLRRARDKVLPRVDTDIQKAMSAALRGEDF